MVVAVAAARPAAGLGLWTAPAFRGAQKQGGGRGAEARPGRGR